MRYLFTDEEVAVIRARCEGTSVVATMDQNDTINADPRREDWLSAARELYADKSDDDIEVDDDASLSPNEELGCWVQGWLYVRREDL